MAENEEPKDEGNPQEEQVEDDESEQSDEDEIINPSASLLLHNYLQSENGHEIAKQVVELIKGIKHSTLDRNVELDKVNAEQTRLRVELMHKHYGRLLTLQTIVFALAIVAASILTYVGKFESPVAILFGTLVGYFFGRKTSSKDG
jgi:hypothetical protein